MCALIANPMSHIVDIRDKPDCTINYQYVIEERKVGKMFLVRDIKLHCDDGYTRFKAEADPGTSDLNSGAFLEGISFYDMTLRVSFTRFSMMVVVNKGKRAWITCLRMKLSNRGLG